MLQKRDLTSAEARALFEKLIGDFPTLRSRLSDSANIIKCKTFEPAVAKIQANREHDLEEDEEAAMASFLLPEEQGEAQPVAEGEVDYAEEALREVKRRKVQTRSRKMPLDFILPTSNECERLFSMCGHAWTKKRGNLDSSISKLRSFSKQTEIFGMMKLFMKHCLNQSAMANEMLRIHKSKYLKIIRNK
jgi:hypothetical protein